ncbi:hypothetical protein LOTGIDRAFT_156345 [Lottia gigantea]|uniref:Uncharacterized protein n=1 Tax=Lottia gigantea TaxID=225164 RepID=V4B0Q4_LOTGI|nr:hypothetical protein LOTGIDRAFT_156345 [Lottia gigantea]ESP03783.1 hypothetical protein LOTGIDRAFT_156345 [Lottia gigantea]
MGNKVDEDGKTDTVKDAEPTDNGEPPPPPEPYKPPLEPFRPLVLPKRKYHTISAPMSRRFGRKIKMGTCGIDVNRPNSYDQTALDIVNKFTTHKGAKELKHILKGKLTKNNVPCSSNNLTVIVCQLRNFECYLYPGQI